MTLHVLSAVVVMLSLSSQVTKMTPDSPRFMNQVDEAPGSTWKVFAVDSYEAGPIGVVQVEEVRQQNPPSEWAVSVRNRGLAPVPLYRLAAATVTGDNKVKAIQQLPAIKNLAPGKVSRQQIKIFPTILTPTDRVVFFVNAVREEASPWQADKDAITALIRMVAARYPVP